MAFFRSDFKLRIYSGIYLGLHPPNSVAEVKGGKTRACPLSLMFPFRLFEWLATPPSKRSSTASKVSLGQISLISFQVWFSRYGRFKVRDMDAPFISYSRNRSFLYRGLLSAPTRAGDIPARTFLLPSTCTSERRIIKRDDAYEGTPNELPNHHFTCPCYRPCIPCSCLLPLAE